MNQAEHAEKLKNLNLSNREFYEQANTIFQEMARACPPETADRVLEFQSEAAGIVERERDFLAGPLHSTEKTLAEIRTKPIPKFRSPIKTAIALALLQNHEASDLDICKAVDEAIEDADGLRRRCYTPEYTNKKKRGKIEATISKVRRVLRSKGFEV